MNPYSYLPTQIGTGMNPGDFNFGVTTAKDVEDLNKALSIDYSEPPTNFSASPLRAYSIDGTLKSVAYTQKNIKLWNRVQKVPAYSTVEEYSMLMSYGNNAVGVFTAAGALPNSHDSSYQRSNVNVKYLGTLRAVQHPATLVRTAPVTDLIAQETINGTTFLLGVIEGSLFTGSVAMNSYEWDGLYTVIQNYFAGAPLSNTVLDLRGAALAKSDMADAANVVLNAYGIPSAFYSDLLVMNDMNTLYYPNQRYNDQAGGRAITGGASQEGFNYMPNMTFEFVPDVFLRPGGPAQSVLPVGAQVPGIPTITSITHAANPGSLFTAGGTAYYQVSAFSAAGESLPSPTVNVTYAAGEANTLNITISAPTLYPAIAYGLYRSDTATGTPTFLGRIPVAATYVDLNTILPGTSKGLLFMEEISNYAFKQLAPFTKIPLATIDASIRWMQLLYGVPICFTPGKNVMFQNIGRRAGSLVQGQ